MPRPTWGSESSGLSGARSWKCSLRRFQKKSGAELMRRHYPAAAAELLEDLEPERSGDEWVWRYPPAVREELAAGLRGALEAHFPQARVLFVC